MDIIYLRELKIETCIGVLAWERVIKQVVVLDIEMATDIRAAAASDQIKDALDYFAVSERVTEFVSQSKCQLIETLAENVAKLILKEFSVKTVKLRLSKPGIIPNAREPGVIIERALN